MHWAAHTSRIRLGTAVVVAPYWHPIRVAGEAALVDLFSDGRLELGMGRGAFQSEFDRMAGGMTQREGGRYMREMLPVVSGLWQGDFEHHGELWRSRGRPRCRSRCRSRIRRSGWRRAIRTPSTGRCKRAPTSWRRRCRARTRRSGFSASASPRRLAKLPGMQRPRFLMLRRTCVCARGGGLVVPVQISAEYDRQFENLFRNVGTVENGFPEPAAWEQIANPDDYSPERVRDGMVVGTPEQVVAKLKQYAAAGVDQFCYGASFGLPHDVAMRSL